MTIITITTDFGLRDGYVGVMKGVIWGINPDAKIVDVTHLISPQDIHQGSIALQRVVPFFPDGTIHLAVVDPGVGTNRRPIAAKIGNHLFVGPDNGLFTRIAQSNSGVMDQTFFVELNQPKFWLREISHVFHGRDIFAPVAAHLSLGIDLQKLGTPIHDPVFLSIPQPELLKEKIIGQVISIDNFGNLATNIFESQLKNYQKQFKVKIKGIDIPDFVETFGAKPSGTLVSLLGTQSDLIIASVNASAQKMLKASVGEIVEVTFGKL